MPLASCFQNAITVKGAFSLERVRQHAISRLPLEWGVGALIHRTEPRTAEPGLHSELFSLWCFAWSNADPNDIGMPVGAGSSTSSAINRRGLGMLKINKTLPHIRNVIACLLQETEWKTRKKTKQSFS